MVLFHKIWKNCNAIQFKKKEMNFNNQKIKNRPQSPSVTSQLKLNN